MIWKLLQSIFGSLIASIQTKLDTWSGNKAIADDETDIVAKKAQADIALKDLNDAGLLKTDIATGIATEKKEMVEADTAVVEQKAVLEAVKKQGEALPDKVETTGEMLDNKFRDL